MKTFFFIVSFLLAVGMAVAQVGINTMSPQAMLDIRSRGNTASTMALSVKNNSSVSLLDIRDDGRIITSGVSLPSILLDLRDGQDNAILAVGESQQTAAYAKGGALKYDVNVKSLYLSDNTQWNQLASDHIKAFVVADITSQLQGFTDNTSNTITDWNIQSDLTGSFNATTGIFTAQRSSIYSVSLNITLEEGSVSAGSEARAVLVASNGKQVTSISTITSVGNFPVGVQCSGSFLLALGETLSVVLFHNMGETKNVKVGYNNLTIVEL